VKENRKKSSIACSKVPTDPINTSSERNTEAKDPVLFS